MNFSTKYQNHQVKSTGNMKWHLQHIFLVIQSTLKVGSDSGAQTYKLYNKIAPKLSLSTNDEICAEKILQ